MHENHPRSPPTGEMDEEDMEKALATDPTNPEPVRYKASVLANRGCLTGAFAVPSQPSSPRCECFGSRNVGRRWEAPLVRTVCSPSLGTLPPSSLDMLLQSIHFSGTQTIDTEGRSLSRVFSRPGTPPSLQVFQFVGRVGEFLGCFSSSAVS